MADKIRKFENDFNHNNISVTDANDTSLYGRFFVNSIQNIPISGAGVLVCFGAIQFFIGTISAPYNFYIRHWANNVWSAWRNYGAGWGIRALQALYLNALKHFKGGASHERFCHENKVEGFVGFWCERLKFHYRKWHLWSLGTDKQAERDWELCACACAGLFIQRGHAIYNVPERITEYFLAKKSVPRHLVTVVRPYWNLITKAGCPA